MNPHNIGYRMAEHSFRQADPGTGEIIPYKEHGQVVGLTVAGTETNTVQAPAKAGQKMTIFVKTYTSGTRTVTFKDSAGTTTGVNQTGDSTVVFNAAGDSATFETREVGSDLYAWKLVAGEGNPTDLGDATFDDVTVLDDLTVAGVVTIQGTDATVLTLDEGDLALTLGDISVAAGNLSIAAGTATFGATASIATVSNGDGVTNLIPKAQVIGTTKATGGLLIGVGSATDTTAVAPNLAFVKSGGASLASFTAVADNEILGEITWFGADGTDLESPAARIYCAVDGTVGTGDMPGELVFQTTTDGGETLATAMTIAPLGNVIASKGFLAKSNRAAAITTTDTLTADDSGGIFSVAKTSAYAITLPTPQQGLMFKFMVLDTGANIVTISNGSAHLFGTVSVNNVSTAMTGTTLSLASGGSVGDWVQFEGIDSTHYLVTGACIAAADITIA